MSAHHPVQAPAVGDALQLVLAGVLEDEPAPGGQVLHGRETSTSDGPGQRRDASADVDRDAGDVVADQLDLAGVAARRGSRRRGDGPPRRSPARTARPARGRRTSRRTRRPPCRSRVPDGARAVARTDRGARCEQLSPAPSPSAAAFSVEPTMSVNSTVASTRSSVGRRRRSPRRNCLDLIEQRVVFAGAGQPVRCRAARTQTRSGDAARRGTAVLACSATIVPSRRARGSECRTVGRIARTSVSL